MSQSPAPLTTSYPPAGHTFEVAGEKFTVPYTSAYQRLHAFIGDTYGYDEDGRWNVSDVTDPFMADIITLLKQAGTAISAVEATAMGALTSCEHEAQYAGGNVSEGNRIFTPQESAARAMKEIREAESK